MFRRTTPRTMIRTASFNQIQRHLSGRKALGVSISSIDTNALDRVRSVSVGSRREYISAGAKHQISSHNLWKSVHKGSTRTFAKSSKNASGLLVNERLIAAVIQRQGATSADDAQVRMIMDQKDGAESHIVSLAIAIQASINLDKDLIEISLDQDVPVVKVDHIKSLEYKQTKKSKTGQAPPEKEFRFRAGIAENDMMRKVDDMIKLLDKGHKCLVSVRCRKYELARDPNMAINTVFKVAGLVNGVGEPTKEPMISPEKNFAQLLLRPASKRKKAIK